MNFLWLVNLYRRVKIRPDCRCGGRLSCTERLVRRGTVTLAGLVMAAASCATHNAPPCSPGEPNCPPAPAPSTQPVGNT